MPLTQATTTIKEQLRALVRLQYIDSKIDQLEKLRGDLPEEIQDLEDEKAGLEIRLKKYAQEEKQDMVARDRAQLDIKEAEELIKRYEQQQLQVRNNREYDALTKEIEAQKQRIEEARQKLEEIAQREVLRTEATAQAQARLEELTNLIKEKREELERILQDTESEQARLQEVRDKAVEDVDKRYYKAYMRLRNRMRDGRAVVPLDRGAAGGFAVPPQRQVEIRQQNRIVVCEHTGRIIVDQSLFEEVEKELNL